LFMALVALLGGVLNALYRFAAAAAAPVLLNLVLIAALLFFADTGPTPGHALAWGVTLAGAGQFVWLVAACHRAGMRLRLPRPCLTPGVRRLLRLMVPLGLTAGVMQINLLVGTVIATFRDGAVAYLYYADRVYQLPLGVVGIAIGTALLPALSRSLRSGDAQAAGEAQSRALEVAALLTLPAAAALAVVPGPIVDVLFARGAFSAADAAATAMALAAFAFGLPAFVLVKVLSPAFFAREDTTTPFKVSLAAVAVNIGLSLALVWPLAHVGIALATTLASWLQAGLMWVVLRRRGHLVLDSRLRARLPRQALSSALMAAALVGLMVPLETAFAGATGMRVAALAALVAGGVAVFGLCAQLTGAARLGELRAMLRRQGG
ncbi:MAG: murein biosynthesis integral membrane protein MurJ, partial [Alphaproteobacteria bacterium]